MSESSPPTAVLRFFKIWQECFAGLLGQLGVASPAVAVTPTLALPLLSPEELSKSVSMRFSGGGVLKGELLWLADTPVALQLGQLHRSEPLDPAAAFSDASRDAFTELLRQAATLAATAWKRESGGETEINFQSVSDPSFLATQRASMRLSGEKIPELSLSLLLDANFCDALSQASVTATVPVTPGDGHPAVHGALPANLDLLLDVELEATIRFGQREMLLRDIFGLMAGAVVELNQSVNEPAELLVAGRLVARGEVVVVDGNFGLRVTEVVSAGQRAELLQF